MAQAQVDLFPEHEFLKWHKNESLFIEGHCLTFNKTHTRKDGLVVSYFYCTNKRAFKCRKSAQAIRQDNNIFLLLGYTGQHCGQCIPNSAYLGVRKVRGAIRDRVLADPTVKPTEVYLTEVNRIRDHLCKTIH